MTTQSDILDLKSGSLLVAELFPTLQGEGPQTGWPSIFVRLAKCNLRCHFCDTSFEEGKHYDLETIVEEVGTLCSARNINLVVITGGEPLLQNVVPLIQRLNHYGISVSIETAGTVFVPGLDPLFAQHPDLLALEASDRQRQTVNNLIICSPKTVGIHPRIRPLVGAFKYIVRAGETDPGDGLPFIGTQRLTDGKIGNREARLFRPDKTNGAGRPPIYVQAMDEHDPERNKSNQSLAVAICMQYGYRLSMQTHKLLDLP